MDLKGSYIIVPISMFISLVMTWLSKQNKSEKEYVKNSIVVGILVSFVVYINNPLTLTEDIIRGPATF